MTKSIFCVGVREINKSGIEYPYPGLHSFKIYELSINALAGASTLSQTIHWFPFVSVTWLMHDVHIIQSMVNQHSSQLPISDGLIDISIGIIHRSSITCVTDGYTSGRQERVEYRWLCAVVPLGGGRRSVSVVIIAVAASCWARFRSFAPLLSAHMTLPDLITPLTQIPYKSARETCSETRQL